MRSARGFSLVSAIFLMVVLVVLGVSMVTISSVQQTTTAQMLQVARAEYAARAGAEWAASQASAWCAGPYPMAITPFTLPAPMSGFTIEVSCTRTAHTFDSATRQYFVVDVTASSGNYAGPDYVRRKVRTKVFGP
jgi:MSHA biogenesis protein MshP